MAHGSDYMAALIECYILKSLGKLSEDRERQVAALEPWLNVTFRNIGPWDKSLSDALGFSPTMPQSLNALYQQYLGHCLANGIKPNPEEFSRQVIKSNFSKHLQIEESM